jgi:hypothetical protein
MPSIFSSKRYSLFLLLFISISNHQIIKTGVGEAYDFISDSGIKKKIGGYIKAEYYYDSRQVVAFDDDQFLAFPKPKLLDPRCKDINKRAEGHYCAIESRLSFQFSGSKVKCADLSGIIEGDFWGATNIDYSKPFNNFIEIPNIFRLRHAAIFLDWPDIKLTMGQYWHPITIQECYANTISFNNGTPIDPFARSPLIMIDYEWCKFHLIACSSFQLDFTSNGPLGFNPVYNALGLVPNFDLQFKQFFDTHSIGAGIDYNRLKPRIMSEEGFAVNEPLSYITAFGWLSLNWPEKFAWHSKFTYAQNGVGYDLIGGYATHSIDPCTGKRTYASINVISYWWDLIAFPEREVEPGLFTGFVKNIGATKSIIPDIVDANGTIINQMVFGFGADIDVVFRVSPRLRWRMSKELTLAAELEYTYASYGDLTTSGKVKNTVPVGNIRGLCAAYYTF